MKNFLKGVKESSTPAMNMLFLLIFTVLLFIASSMKAQANINSKEEFITSEIFEKLEVSDAEWQTREEGLFFNKVENPYDLFAVETDNKESFQLKVYDSPVNGEYIVEIVEK